MANGMALCSLKLKYGEPKHKNKKMPAAARNSKASDNNWSKRKNLRPMRRRRWQNFKHTKLIGGFLVPKNKQSFRISLHIPVNPLLL